MFSPYSPLKRDEAFQLSNFQIAHPSKETYVSEKRNDKEDVWKCSNAKMLRKGAFSWLRHFLDMNFSLNTFVSFSLAVNQLIIRRFRLEKWKNCILCWNVSMNQWINQSTNRLIGISLLMPSERLQVRKMVSL